LLVSVGGCLGLEGLAVAFPFRSCPPCVELAELFEHWCLAGVRVAPGASLAGDSSFVAYHDIFFQFVLSSRYSRVRLFLGGITVLPGRPSASCSARIHAAGKMYAPGRGSRLNVPTCSCS